MDSHLVYETHKVFLPKVSFPLPLPLVYFCRIPGSANKELHHVSHMNLRCPRADDTTAHSSVHQQHRTLILTAGQEVPRLLVV